MKYTLLLLGISSVMILLSSCAKEELLYNVNEKFNIYHSLSCDCRAMYIESGDGKKELLIEDVNTVMGNRGRFLLGTMDPHVFTKTWYLVVSDVVNNKDDLRALTSNQVEALLEELKLDFAKTFEE
jgi:hypothetical protein